MKRMISEKVAEQLKDLQGKWVALAGDGDAMAVVGSGNDAVEARREARKRGYEDKETTLHKVLPTDVYYVPAV